MYFIFQDLNAIGFIGFAVVVLALVILRWRRSRGLTRAALSPVIAGAVAFAVLNVVLLLMALATRDNLPFAGPLLLMTRLLIPVGLVALFLRFYSTRAAVARALLRIGRGASVGVIEDALRTSLGDPEVVVGRWSAAGNGFVDRSGRPLDLTGAAMDQAVLRDRWCRSLPIAAVKCTTPMLDADDELLDRNIGEAVEYALDVADLRDDI